MDEDVGALGELDEVVGGRRVARDDDRPVARVEAIAEGRHDRRMIDERGRDLQVLVLQDQAALASARGRWTSGHERHPALVGDAGLDVVGVHLEEEPRHLLERRRPPGVDPRPQARGPGQPDQVAVVGVVVRMVVGEEDVAQAWAAGLPAIPAGARRRRRSRRRRRCRSRRSPAPRPSWPFGAAARRRCPGGSAGSCAVLATGRSSGAPRRSTRQRRRPGTRRPCVPGSDSSAFAHRGPCLPIPAGRGSARGRARTCPSR